MHHVDRRVELYLTDEAVEKSGRAPVETTPILRRQILPVAGAHVVFRTVMNATPRSPSVDSTNVDREAFDRDGRNQASVGSTGSVTMSAAAGGGSTGSGGFNSRRDSSGRARSSTGHSEAAVGGGQQAAARSRVAAAEFNPFRKQDEKEVRRSIRRRVKRAFLLYNVEVERWRRGWRGYGKGKGSRGGEPHRRTPNATPQPIIFFR